MRFAGRVSAANYIAAGRAAADQSSDMQAIARNYSPDYQALSETAINEEAKNYKTGQDVYAEVAEAGINAQAKVALANEKVNVAKAKDEGRRGAARGAMISAAGGFIGNALEKMPDSLTKPYQGMDRTPMQNLLDRYTNQIKEGQTKYESIMSEPIETPSATVSTGTISSDGSPSDYTALTGARKEIADAIAGPESGSWGYEAFNQGGTNNGRGVLGKSGSYKEHFGRSLTDMTLGDIFHLQNTAQRGMSMSEHLASGGLHAVGRYQFIGPTLQDEVSRMGLSLDTKFTPQVQDDIFFSHAKRIGNISPWIGPTDKYGAEKKAHLNSLIQGL